jgi:hypothetical protein
MAYKAEMTHLRQLIHGEKLARAASVPAEMGSWGAGLPELPAG